MSLDHRSSSFDAFADLKPHHVADSSDDSVALYLIPDGKEPTGKRCFFRHLDGPMVKSFDKVPYFDKSFQVFVLHFIDGTCQKYFINLRARPVQFLAESDFRALHEDQSSVAQDSESGPGYLSATLASLQSIHTSFNNILRDSRGGLVYFLVAAGLIAAGAHHLLSSSEDSDVSRVPHSRKYHPPQPLPLADDFAFDSKEDPEKMLLLQLFHSLQFDPLKGMPTSASLEGMLSTLSSLQDSALPPLRLVLGPKGDSVASQSVFILRGSDPVISFSSPGTGYCKMTFSFFGGDVEVLHYRVLSDGSGFLMGSSSSKDDLHDPDSRIY